MVGPHVGECMPGAGDTLSCCSSVCTISWFIMSCQAVQWVTLWCSCFNAASLSASGRFKPWMRVFSCENTAVSRLYTYGLYACTEHHFR